MDDKHSKSRYWLSKWLYAEFMMAELLIRHMLFGISTTLSSVPPGTISISPLTILSSQVEKFTNLSLLALLTFRFSTLMFIFSLYIVQCCCHWSIFQINARAVSASSVTLPYNWPALTEIAA